jgi:hypothetical protein
VEQVINKIIEVEKSAAQIMDEARKIKDELPNKIKQDAEALNALYIEKEKARIEKVRESEKAYFEQSSAELDERKKNDIEKMQKAFNENADKWVELLFNRITGR